jgi:hypothetical protein
VVRSLTSEPSDMMAPVEPSMAVTNAMLVIASEWSVRFDIRSNHLRCIGCQQSILSMGKNGIGYTSSIQEMMGQIVAHMIQAHKFTREGLLENGG